MKNLADRNENTKIALITGARSGIGKALVSAFSERGVKTIGLDKEVDVRKSKVISRAVKKVVKKYGHIDIVVNNAAVAIYKPITKLTEKEWQRVIDTNLSGTFNVTKAVLPVLLKRHSGVIINISSQLGRRGYPGLTSYCASKFGIIGFTESLAGELKGTGVKTYAILPGGVDTRLYHNINKVESKYVGFKYSITKERKRILKPEEIAEPIVNLALNRQLKSGSKIEISKKGQRMIKRTYL